MLEKLANQTAYKTCALAGSLVAILLPFFASQYISSLEEKAVSIFEQGILTKLDLESTQIQFKLINDAIAASQNDVIAPNTVDYTESELEHLQAESLNLNSQIESLALSVGTIEATKKAIITEVKLTIFLSFLVMLISTLIAAFGYLGWYFHIRIYQERRSEFGEGRYTDK